MSNIYQRIGEAVASQGSITLVAALNDEEREVLQKTGFKCVGTMDINGILVHVYDTSAKEPAITSIEDFFKPTPAKKPYTASYDVPVGDGIWLEKAYNPSTDGWLYNSYIAK